VEFEFRALAAEDFERMHRWLNTPHVSEWWGGGATMEDVVREYSSYLDGTEKVRGYIVSLEGAPIGHVQWIRYGDYPDYMRIVGNDNPNAANCDVFIGEVDHLHRGLGGPLLIQFIRDVIFADPSITTCFIDPHPSNRIAIRAYEKAGFRSVRDVADDGHGEPVHLMEMKRPE
jgi:aminoglycoside 6'-N-acetyltransferase